MKLALIIFCGLLVLAVLIVFIADYSFSQRVKGEVEELFADSRVSGKDIIKKEDLAGLPLPVQKWLEGAQVVGMEKIHTVRLKQEARLRLEKDKPWMMAEAQQYFTVDEPGFIWKAQIKAAPFFHIAGRDKYFRGRGNMLIKPLSLLTVADASGEEIDQGTLVRFLVETVWFPTAALCDYINWEEIDSHSARATMSYGGVTAAGTFYFDPEYRVIRFVAERYMEQKGEFSLETWSCHLDEYKNIAGLLIPVKGSIIWELNSGDFEWFQFTITDLEYNVPRVY